METDRTGAFEYEARLTNEERQSIIIEIIEDEIKEVKQQIEKPIRDKEFFQLRGMQEALKQLKVQINAIQEDSIHLVDPSSRSIGTPQHLRTDNKFLNAAYFQAKIIRDTPRGLDGSVASSPEGEAGKREVMSKIMVYIKAMV